MFGPRLSLPTKIKTKFIVLGLMTLIVVAVVIAIIRSLSQTNLVIELLKQQNFSQAQKVAQSAKITPTVLSLITFRQSSTLESWRLALASLDELENFVTQLNFVGRNLLDQSQPEANLQSLEQSWTALLNQTTALEATSKQSWYLKKTPWLESLAKFNQAGADSLQISQYLSTGQKQVLVLLQNTEELRATGGFMGSYAKIILDQGKVISLEIQDIYEPDGQFRGFVDAPPGAKEYLSGGQGLRLPDSNWNPDFPSAAKTIATYFSFGQEQGIDLLVTLNVDLVEKILKIVGDVYLPDYGLTASASNLTDLAHADRNAFFAGSKQKVIFLESLLTNLKIKLATLSNQQLQSLAQTLKTGLAKKELQFFSWENEIETIFAKYQIAGGLNRPKAADLFFASVESNVGINKANKKISRTVSMTFNQQSLVANTLFHNDLEKGQADYINYQRYYFDPAVTVREIAYNQQTIATFDETIQTTADGTSYKEIGFLVAVPAGETGELTIAVSYPTICQINHCQLAIWKQSGLPPTPYRITFDDQTQNFLLEQDELINFNQL